MTCSVDGCGDPVHGRGLCSKHLKRLRKYGNVVTVLVPGKRGKRYRHTPSTKPITLLERPCSEWQGCRNKDGYGQYHHMGLHRWVWEQVNGPVPEGMIVMHRCDNPPCFLYEHLFLGTDADNAADREAKGRNRNGDRGRRLTTEQVEAMRSHHAAGVRVRDLVIEYGLNQATVSNILDGLTYREVGGPVRPTGRKR